MTSKKILEALRQKNRTLLEMILGILAFGLVIQAVLLFVSGDRLVPWSLSNLLGIVLALIAVQHMYRTLDRALDLGEAGAQKTVYMGYLTRYLVLVIVLVLVTVSGYLNPLLVFLAYMSLKVTVYLQPFTHKLCNKLFHETDPIPEPCPEQDSRVEGTEE